jgi:hypothetical protein
VARAPTILLATACVGVGGLGVALFVLTRDTSEPPASPHRTATGEPALPAKPVAEDDAPAPSRDAPSQGRAAVAPGHPHAPALPPALTALAAYIEPHDGKRDANGKLVPIVTVAQLKTRLHLTDAPMQACVDKSNQRPTGSATLSFTVAARDRKLIVESTGIDDEASLASYPELLACMHDTAHALHLDDFAVPELGTAIYVRRHVRLDAGVIAENSIFNFSYNPR